MRQHFQQANTGVGHEFSGLKGYLLARLLWNPDVDLEAVRNDFLEGYYGAAAKPLRKYIDRLQTRLIESGSRLAHLRRRPLLVLSGRDRRRGRRPESSHALPCRFRQAIYSTSPTQPSLSRTNTGVFAATMPSG